MAGQTSGNSLRAEGTVHPEQTQTTRLTDEQIRDSMAQIYRETRPPRARGLNGDSIWSRTLLALIVVLTLPIIIPWAVIRAIGEMVSHVQDAILLAAGALLFVAGALALIFVAVKLVKWIWYF
jgi:hypothetical protein